MKKMAVLAMIFILSATVLAQEKPPQADQTGIYLGPGVVVTTKPYKGVGTTVMPIPFFAYRGENFFLLGPTGGAKLFRDEQVSLYLIGSVRFDGFEPGDSGDLSGMADRHSAFDAGAELSYFDDWGKLSLLFLTDVSSTHDGSEIQLSASKDYRQNQMTLTPGVGLSWQNSNLQDYYYGVRRDEARSGRPYYKASEGINQFGMLKVRYQLEDQCSLFATLKYEYLNHEITDSPIVNEHYTISTIFGLIFKF